MKHIIFIPIMVAVSLHLSAQSLSPTVIASTGGFSSNANGSLSYTVGEMTMVQTFSANGNILTQGFQQPNENITGLLDLTQDAFGSFAVYPNPAVDNLWYGFQFPEEGRVAITVYDLLGQKLNDVYTGNYTTGKTTDGFAVSNLAAGSYYLSLVFTAGKSNQTHLITKPFQIIR